MKKIALYFLFLLLLPGNYLSAQNSFPKIINNEIPGIKIIQEKSYDGNSLWGYIDGGADIYLEYGFKKLQSYDIELNGIKYKIDIYNMTDDESAYGIFSASSFKCTGSDSLIQYSCVSKYQHQFALGAFYVSIINDKGSPESGSNAAAIAKIIAAKMEPNSFVLPAIYNAHFLSMYKKDVKCYKGILGIQNGIPEWETLFTNVTFNSVYTLCVDAGSGSTIVSYVKFNNYDGLKKFGTKFKIDNLEAVKKKSAERAGKTIHLWKLSETALVFTELKKGDAEAEAIINKVNEFIKDTCK